MIIRLVTICFNHKSELSSKNQKSWARDNSLALQQATTPQHMNCNNCGKLILYTKNVRHSGSKYSFDPDRRNSCRVCPVVTEGHCERFEPRTVATAVWSNIKEPPYFCVAKHHLWAFSSSVSLPIICEPPHHLWASPSSVRLLIICAPLHHLWASSSSVSLNIICEPPHHLWASSSSVSLHIICEPPHHLWAST